MATKHFLSHDASRLVKIDKENYVEFTPFWRCDSTGTNWGIAFTDSAEVAEALLKDPFVKEISAEDFAAYDRQRASLRSASNIVNLGSAARPLMSADGNFSKLGNLNAVPAPEAKKAAVPVEAVLSPKK